MPKPGEDIEQRIESNGLSAARRTLLRDFLQAAVDADPAVTVQLGEDRWAALEIVRNGRSVARVFTKSGTVQISNFLPGDPTSPYGPGVRLNEKRQWVFSVRSEADAERMLRCLSENIAHLRGGPAIRSTRAGRPARDPGERPPRAMSRRVRFTVLVRDNYTCQYCGRRSPDVRLHVDHRKPVSLGGDDALENLLTACEDCNLGKSNRFTT